MKWPIDTFHDHRWDDNSGTVHTCRLADDGPDHPRWVAPLSPNCHVRVHYGADGEEYNSQLIERLTTLEDED